MQLTYQQIQHIYDIQNPSGAQKAYLEGKLELATIRPETFRNYLDLENKKRYDKVVKC